MTVAAIIQARLGSTRLPGKMMMPLGQKVTIDRVIERTVLASTLDEVVLATTTRDHDALLVDRAEELGVSAHRGDEVDVLGRFLDAAADAEADVIVRIAGDCPFVTPEVVDHAVHRLRETDAEYVSNKLERTFPLGLDVEAFTRESFRRVEATTEAEYFREHVTTYYLENRDDFRCRNFTSDEVFEANRYRDRTDVELVIDEAPDYRFLNAIYTEFPESEVDVRNVIDFLDSGGIDRSNTSVERTHEKDPGL